MYWFFLAIAGLLLYVFTLYDDDKTQLRVMTIIFCAVACFGLWRVSVDQKEYGYNIGYSHGEDSGYSAGKEYGLSIGEKAGYRSGEEDGYWKGQIDLLISQNKLTPASKLADDNGLYPYFLQTMREYGHDTSQW